MKKIWNKIEITSIGSCKNELKTNLPYCLKSDFLHLLINGM